MDVVGLVALATHKGIFGEAADMALIGEMLDEKSHHSDSGFALRRSTGSGPSGVDLTQLLSNASTVKTRWTSVWDISGTRKSTSSELRVSRTNYICAESEVLFLMQNSPYASSQVNRGSDSFACQK